MSSAHKFHTNYDTRSVELTLYGFITGNGSVDSTPPNYAEVDIDATKSSIFTLDMSPLNSSNISGGRYRYHVRFNITSTAPPTYMPGHEIHIIAKMKQDLSKEQIFELGTGFTTTPSRQIYYYGIDGLITAPAYNSFTNRYLNLTGGGGYSNILQSEYTVFTFISDGSSYILKTMPPNMSVYSTYTGIE